MRKLNSQIDDQQQDFERELEERQELQLQQEELRHSLLAEMESRKLKSEERLGELAAEAQLEAAEKVGLAGKLEEKKRGFGFRSGRRRGGGGGGQRR